MALRTLTYCSLFFVPCDVLELLKIHASPRQGDDVLAWGPKRLGIFSVKSTYNFAFEESCRQSAQGSSPALDGGRTCCKLIWGSKVPPTVKNFAWRVASNSLPTWQNKCKRNLEVTNICPLCGTEMEDCFHALCRCPLAVQLWDCMSEVWPLPKLNEISNVGV